MNSKTTSVVLIVITIASLAFGAYSYNRASKLSNETEEWKTKYEEAIVDAENAAQKIELMREDLEKALKDSELHRIQAEAALAELQKHKSGK